MTNSTPDRDHRGRFAAGNQGGPGRRRGHANALRRAAEEAISPEHVAAIMRRATRKAVLSENSNDTDPAVPCRVRARQRESHSAHSTELRACWTHLEPGSTRPTELSRQPSPYAAARW